MLRTPMVLSALHSTSNHQSGRAASARVGWTTVMFPFDHDQLIDQVPLGQYLRLRRRLRAMRVEGWSIETVAEQLGGESRWAS